MQFATHKTATPPLAGELIAQQTIMCRTARKIAARILTQHQQKGEYLSAELMIFINVPDKYSLFCINWVKF
jgi:hypothetical protein